MKVAIIDNEDNIRLGLKQIIHAYCPDVKELKEANGVSSGYDLIVSFRPDIVFLDMEMDDGTGVDLLKKFQEYDFQLIFITAHEKYALDAIKFSAIDFLLKPVDAEELVTCILKAQKRLNNQHLQQQIQVLRESMESLKSGDAKIVLRDSESIYFVKISDIIRCESEKSYTTFIFHQHKNITVSKGLKDFEEMLEKHGFIRTHQSHLVNISKIMRFDRGDGGSLVMENNDVVPVSQRKREEILELFKNI